MKMQGDMLGLRPEVPESLKVLRIESPEGLNERTAWENACGKCGTERVAYVASYAAGFLYVLAAPVSDLPPASWCPFASVLPSGSLEGTVAYGFGTAARQTVLVIPADGDPKLFTGPPSGVAKAVEKYGVSIQTLDGEHTGTVTPWVVQSLAEEQFVRAVGGLIVRRAVGIMAASVAVVTVCGVVSAGVGLLTSASTEAATKRALAVVSDARTLATNDIAAQLGRFDDVDRSVLQLGGDLLSFKVTKGGAATWRASFPKTVTADAIEAMGGRSDTVHADGGVYAVSR
ncbi:hypothetical protein ABMY26_07325 (plasmid) [Azospirillum sp. HJ39]|uniref:hypothetical protein n=1 Tax=Azospirillum sp. HJ39 TaxID=3159496 RepID=UPI00355783BF